MTTQLRTAEVLVGTTTAEAAVRTVAAYLPGNYHVLGEAKEARDLNWLVTVQGTDFMGWTLNDYVIPRLASSGHMGAREVPTPLTTIPDGLPGAGTPWPPAEVRAEQEQVIPQEHLDRAEAAYQEQQMAKFPGPNYRDHPDREFQADK